MTRRHAMRRALAIALPLLLTACAGIAPPTVPGKDARPQAEQAIERVFHDTIDLGGRISVRYQRAQKEEALHGSFAWTQTPAHTSVTLLSPLGQTMAIINVTPRGATLAQSGQSARAATDVDTLTANTLGWPLPVAGLREWLQGFGVDSAGRRFVASPQHDGMTTRDGWRIRYAGWHADTSSSQPRPKRIDLARYTEQAGDVVIRIVIDTWQAH